MCSLTSHKEKGSGHVMRTVVQLLWLCFWFWSSRDTLLLQSPNNEGSKGSSYKLYNQMGKHALVKQYCEWVETNK